MAQHKNSIHFRSLAFLALNLRTLAIFSSSIFLSGVGVQLLTPMAAIAQQPEINSTEADRAAAEKAYAQAEQLFQQRTAESLKQAIAKYESALKLWRAINDQKQEALTLQGLGLTYFFLGEMPKSLQYYELALSIHRSRKDVGREAALLISVAGNYSNLGEQQKAIDYYQKALVLLDSLKATSFKNFALQGLASAYRSLGDAPKALGFLNQALEIQKADANQAGTAETLQTIGQLYLSLGQNQKALESFNQALPIVQAIKDIKGEASTRLYIGLVSFSTGNNQQALASFNQARGLFNQAGDPAGEALALQTLGGAYKSLNQSQKALEIFEQGLSAFVKLGFLPGQAAIHNNIGSLYGEFGEPQKSLDSYNRALAIYRNMKNPTQIASSLNRIGEVYSYLGDKQKAINTYNEALEIQRQIKDRKGEASTLNSIGEIYSSLGDYQSAIKSFDRALAIFRDIDDRTSIAATLTKISSAYSSLENYQQALNFANQTLAVYRSQQNRFGEGTTLASIVRIYESLGEYQKALDMSNQLVSEARTQKDSFLEATGLIFQGRVYRAKGNLTQALAAFNQALPLVRTLNNPSIEAGTLENFAKTYNLSNQPQKSVEAYKQALLLWQKIGDRAKEAETFYNLANSYRSQRSLQDSLTQIESALKIVESLRTNLDSQELRTSYFASVNKYYQFYIDLLMELHKDNPKLGYDGRALQASERARARTLLEVLTEARADIRQGDNSQLLAQERSLQEKINTKSENQQKLMIAGKEAEALVIKKEVDALTTQYQQVQAQIKAANPRYAAITQPQPLTLQEIQQQVLDDNTLLLQYSLGDDRSYLWAVTKTTITSYELPKRATIETLAKRFDKEELTPLGSGFIRGERPSILLSKMILAPVASQLGQKRLVIVSDGALQYIPFAALPVPNANTDRKKQPVRLIEQHEIISLPSASTLAVLRRDISGRKPATKTVALLADPVFSAQDERVRGRSPSTGNTEVISQVQTLSRSTSQSGISLSRLPYTRSEAESILALVPEKERKHSLDFAASLSAATSPDLAQYRIVHFATHGILNRKDPTLSGLVLSLVDEKGEPQNGFLRMQEVWNLKLPVELVVLSACQTGLGQDIKGEGLIGLTRGFMYAGARRVVVSLWSVNDQATSELMTIFYREMLKENLSPAAALRVAQVEMSKKPQWRSPYFWAAFVLQGDWK